MGLKQKCGIVFYPARLEGFESILTFSFAHIECLNIISVLIHISFEWLNYEVNILLQKKCLVL